MEETKAEEELGNRVQPYYLFIIFLFIVHPFIYF